MIGLLLLLVLSWSVVLWGIGGVPLLWEVGRVFLAVVALVCVFRVWDRFVARWRAGRSSTGLKGGADVE